MSYAYESMDRGAELLDQEAAKRRSAPAEAPPRLVSMELGQLLAHTFPAQEPLLGPWLRKQTLAMVHAWRGVGKTHFALGFAYAVASGGPFLKWRAEQPRRVVYIDGEMPGADIQQRAAAIIASADGQSQPPPDHFRIVTPDAQDNPLPDLSTVSGQNAYTDVIRDADLVVIDNLSALCRSGPENEGESWLPVAGWALARRREGRAVVFLHHDGKNGQQRGSSRREDLLDVVISLSRPSDYQEREGARFLVKFKKGRGLRGPDLDAIEARLATDAHGIQQWTWKAADAADDARILELLQLGMGDADVAAEVACNRSTIFRARKRFQAEGTLQRANRKQSD